MWGQVLLWYRHTLPCRIIPTRVGTSQKLKKQTGIQRDHPHACGDKVQSDTVLSSAMGSSPRVWGQVLAWTSRIGYFRIIPTRVGTSDYNVLDVCSFEDHPHACGDKNLLTNSMYSILGSSPRVWGQAFLRIFYVNGYRIIPTRVGTSMKHILTVTGEGDHPHACGDKSPMFSRR